MTLEQALQAHTSRAGSEWFAGGSSGRSGRLAAGFLADFVVLSDNPLKGHDSMAGVRVLQTFVGGQCVFNASGGNGM
jgi:predicted amidohydrolase YtcJ